MDATTTELVGQFGVLGAVLLLVVKDWLARGKQNPCKDDVCRVLGEGLAEVRDELKEHTKLLARIEARQ